MTLRRILPLAAALATLAGCGSLDNVRHTDRQTDRSIADANRAAEAMRNVQNQPADMAAVISDQQYVDTTPLVLSRASQLQSKCNITYSPAKGMTLLETGQLISKLCGLEVRVTPDALGMGSTAEAGNAVQAATGPQSIPLPPGVSLPPSPGGVTTMPLGGSRSLADQLVDIRYTGPLPGFLDALTARFGLSWRVDRGAVVIFRTETKVFHVYNMPKALDMSSVFSSGTTTTAGVSGGAGGSTGGSSGGSGGVGGSTGSMQTTSVALKTDPAKDLVEAVKAMTTPGSGQSFYSSSNGTLIVTDTPEVLNRVGTYVAALNTTYSKQVLVNVQLLAVTVNDNDSYGLNWTAVYQDMAKNFGFKLSNTYTATSGAVSGAINILSGNSQWSGSQALVNALATQGRVRVLTEPSVVARNLTPAPIQVAHQTGFIAQSSTTITGGNGGFSQSSLTPGTVTTGFNMWAMPMVYPDNKTLELSLSVNLSDLVQIIHKESGDSAIEFPELDNKMFSPDVTLRSGDTAVIASFKQAALDNERSGTGSARNWLFGGGITGTRKTTYIVIVVTPVVLADKLPAAALSMD